MSTGPVTFAFPAVLTDPNGHCSPAAYTGAGIKIHPQALISLVIAEGPLGIPKARGQYGHLVTKAIAAKHYPANTHYRLHPLSDDSKPSESSQQEFNRWNDPVNDWLQRTDFVRKEEICGLLVVSRHWDPASAAYGSPFLRVVAAPTVASTAESDLIRAGALPEDLWHPLPMSITQLRIDTPILPLMASTSGFPRQLSNPTFSSILDEGQSLIFPSVQELFSPIALDAVTFIKNWLIPPGCNLPIGLGWKLDDFLTIKDMTESLIKISPRAYRMFAHFLERPEVAIWLEKVLAQPILFAVPAISYDILEPDFPKLSDDPYPSSIACPLSLSPWVDMRYLHVWKHVLDMMESKSTSEEPTIFRRFIKHAATALHPKTYAGTVTNPRRFPNMAYHFKAFGGWPFPGSIMHEMSHPYLVSEEAQTYPTIQVDIQDPQPAALPLLETAAQAALSAHAQSTPVYTIADSLQKSTRSVASAGHTQRTAATTGTRQVPVDLASVSDQIDATSYQQQKQFSPAPPASAGHYRDSGQPQQQAAATSHTLFREPPVPSPVPAPASASAPAQASAKQVPKWGECMAWVITAPSRRAQCDKAYVLACFLLIHAAIPIQNEHHTYLHHKSAATQMEATPLYPRNMSAQFRQSILYPIFNSVASLHEVTEYLRHIADQCHLSQFNSVYDTSFFTSPQLQKLFRLSNWDMSEHFNPSSSSTSAWSVYSFISCLATKPHHPPILPSSGLSLSEVKYMIQFVYIWFRSMDSKSRDLPAPFAASALGQRLWRLRSLLHDPAMDNLWPQDPASLSYQFCDSLRDLLYPYQSLAYYASWATDYSFDTQSPDLQILPHTDDRLPFYHLLRQVDDRYDERWNPNKLRSLSSFQQQVPLNHFESPTRPPPVAGREKSPKLPPPKEKDRPISDIKRRLHERPDFQAKEHVFDLVNPPTTTTHPSEVIQSFRKAVDHTVRMFQLPDAEGKLQLMCLAASCQPPFNRCCLATCGYKPKRRAGPPRTTPPPSFMIKTYLHVDLSLPIWRNKPETYWAEAVTYLKLPGMSANVRPSIFLKALTPSANWA